MRNILKSQRKARNLTHEEIAAQIGVTRSAYTNIETGTRNPSLALSLKIKNVLNYHTDDIFDNNEKECVQSA